MQNQREIKVQLNTEIEITYWEMGSMEVSEQAWAKCGDVCEAWVCVYEREREGTIEMEMQSEKELGVVQKYVSLHFSRFPFQFWNGNEPADIYIMCLSTSHFYYLSRLSSQIAVLSLFPLDFTVSISLHPSPFITFILPTCPSLRFLSIYG